MVTLDMVKGDMAEADERREKETLAKEKKQKGRKNKDAAGCEDDKSFKTAKKKKDEVTKEGSLNTEKKKTMKKKRELEDQEEPSGKKKKDEVTKEGSLNTEKKKTMKKKRELEDQEEPSGKKQKKLKKTNHKSVQSKAEEEEVLATKKIKSKKVKAQNPSEVINIDESEEEVVVMKKTTKKKTTGSKTSVTKTIASEEESQGVDQKAKKSRAHLEMGKDTLETVQKKKGKQEETKPIKGKKGSSSVVVVEEDGPKPKKKKEINRGKREVSLKVEVAQEVSIVDDKQQKSKKKKNAKEDKQTAVKDMAQNTETFVFVASDSKGKVKGGIKGAPEEIKTKAKKEEVEVSVDKEEKKKKKRRKKIKLEEEAPQPPPEATPHKDVVFLSEKSGNRDEVTINQERRLALQMDIDKESHPPTKPLGFGQWGTAQFESTDKQQKFLRLMGGFKKEGNNASPSGPCSARSNMALAGEKQQDLQQALLGEFERAQSRRVDFSGRGAGLGFSSAPPSKKFSIDANASRSVRFDD
ncbi:lysine-rich nucleolar protein 1 isoform X1 [Gadus morhua]|uniref:lysine-rich nucleolar protein 1 isoform X1 n=1 Tax=Gadus morhua TaxID=8049 RepID=UPI0011B67DDE|nr:lysine-rich nucleolar protein 1 isoform X1 [Gadus morhua]XP_030207928.1 lysine-rich nucleolar protein 1 isoform X1 [Gadus morhua]